MTNDVDLINFNHLSKACSNRMDPLVDASLPECYNDEIYFSQPLSKFNCGFNESGYIPCEARWCVLE